MSSKFALHFRSERPYNRAHRDSPCTVMEEETVVGVFQLGSTQEQGGPRGGQRDKGDWIRLQRSMPEVDASHSDCNRAHYYESQQSALDLAAMAWDM